MFRYDVINRLVDKYDLASYLEVGTCKKKDNFDFVRCSLKKSVDIDPKSDADYVMSSDVYFSTHDDKFDIIFIDAMHHYENALKDIINALEHLNKGGVIVMHDCLPSSERLQARPRVSVEWTGDVWKAFLLYKRVSQYRCYIVDCDYGCGVIDTNIATDQDGFNISMLDWDYLVKNRDKMGIRPDVI